MSDTWKDSEYRQTKREYHNLCVRQSLKWLQQCLDYPTPAMRPAHVKLVRLAIRDKR
jgi:hypothetical protein